MNTYDPADYIVYVRLTGGTGRGADPVDPARPARLASGPAGGSASPRPSSSTAS